MILEDFKLTIISEWTEQQPKNSKIKTPIVHRTKIGSVKIDYVVSPEAVGKLVDVLHDEVFEHEGVKIDISATSINY